MGIELVNIFQFKPYSAEIISIKQDSYGVVVEDIEKILKERKRKMQPIPKVRYCYMSLNVIF